MLLNFFTDSASFFLGGLSGIPGVRAFAFYVGIALMFNFILQFTFTCFIAILSLDISRREKNHYDLFCCVQGKSVEKIKARCKGRITMEGGEVQRLLRQNLKNTHNFPCKLDSKLVHGQIPPDVFEKYQSYFLQDIPFEDCPKEGPAAYSQTVNGTVNRHTASYFMTYHRILKSSQDYTDAMKETRMIAANITETLNRETNSTRHEVFPYSVFYAFYEQYLTMWRETLQSLGKSFVTIFMITFSPTGFDIYSALVINLTIFMIVTNMGGLMYHWNISLNAVSLMNLVMAMKIAEEFWPCSSTRELAAELHQGVCAAMETIFLSLEGSLGLIEFDREEEEEEQEDNVRLRQAVFQDSATNTVIHIAFGTLDGLFKIRFSNLSFLKPGDILQRITGHFFITRERRQEGAEERERLDFNFDCNRVNHFFTVQPQEISRFEEPVGWGGGITINITYLRERE